MSNQFDDFLDRDFSCPGNDSLQDSIRKLTIRTLRRRRQMKWLSVAGLAAACYAAGLATMWLVPRPIAANPEMVRGIVPTPPPVIVAERKIEAPPAEEKLPEIAALYEWEALEKPANRAANFLKAGNLYLEREQDCAGALRCYTQALDAGGLQVLEVTPDDNWLVTALKNDRRKDKSDER